MQSHINADYDGFSGVSAYTTAMKKFLSIGCDVQITELDITMENGKYTLQQQADKYKAIFQAAMDWNKIQPPMDGSRQFVSGGQMMPTLGSKQKTHRCSMIPIISQSSPIQL